LDFPKREVATMNTRMHAVLAVAALITLAPAAALALTPYSQDFESLDKNDTTALELDGWLVYGNVSTPTGTYLYGYGPFVAPNDGFAFCQVDSGQGGVDQGEQQLVVFSDYNNAGAHDVGNLVESNVFQEQTVAAEDVGEIWVFTFDAKLGNIEGASTAAAFIKTLDPANGWALTNYISEDMTATPVEWQGYRLAITIDEGLVGQILQIGFVNVATDYEGAGIFYDNLNWLVGGLTSVPDLAGTQLSQNHPNPFNPSTRIDFALKSADQVELAVFDLAGRRVALLQKGQLDRGDHHVIWNGTDDTGAAVATGHYRYVLTTSRGSVSRSMILLK